MRVHRLTFEAIGPFPGRHTIDVDRLAAGGLFLLEGPTGAGKSTIIDAVVFALYGQVAAAEASADRLHSDHAAPGVEPFVDMVFSTAAGTYRVWRSPKHERPKQRGTGTVTQNARAKLWRLSSVEDEVGEAVSAHVQEVGGELGRIVALDRAQFTQTVVLPQGQFASFLRARPEDRRTVLQEVFGTEIYERVQKQLTEMARQARSRVAGTAAEVDARVAAFTQAAGLPEEEAELLVEAADASDSAALLARTEQVCRQAEERAAAAQAEEERATAAEQEAQTALDRHKDLRDRLRRRAALLVEQAQLEERGAEVDDAAQRLVLARRAATVTAALRAHEAAQARRERALAALEDVATTSQVVPAVVAAELGTEHLHHLREQLEEVTAERGALSELVALERGLAERAAGLAATERTLAETEAEVAALRQGLDARPARRAALDDELGALRERAAGLPGARQALAAATARTAAAHRVEQLTEAVATARHRLQRAADRAATAADAEHDLRRRWVAGIAGELAGSLREGTACPVCGSTHHPHAAAPARDHPGAEQVDTATADRQAADEALVAAKTETARAEEQLTAARGAAEGRDTTTARTEQEEADRAVEAAEDAARRAGELEERLAGFDAETQRLTDELAARGNALATATERLAGEQRLLATDADRCRAAAAGAPSVTARAQDLAARAEDLRRVAGHLEEQLDATRAATEAADHLHQDLADAGFRDVAAARSAALPEDRTAALENQVQEHRSAMDRVAAGLAEAGVAELTGAEVADVPAAEEGHRRAQHARTEATRRCAEATSRAEQSARARQALVVALERHRVQTEEAAPVLRMAGLATATEGNEATTTLATFVLLRRFEDVVAAGNERLSEMSGGRYSLERIDSEGGQRSRKAGLGLQVRDHVTEVPRDPHTLSGGETFYVSLCLALGLADVVRSEAGGVELGTLFVDEGFGSLDPETLEGVMRELGKLQSGGRAVGIVSHVTELKSRIAERIEVRRLPDGASTLSVRA